MRFLALAAIGLLAACDRPAPVADNAAAPGANEADATAATPAAAPLGTAPATKEAALKLMHVRHENMEDIGDATKAVGRTLKSDSPDLTVIRDAAATYSRLAPHAATWFPPGTGPETGKTHAKPAIWEKPQDFAQKAREFQGAVRAFDAAATSGDLAAINQAFADLGKSCKACHDPYRAKDD